MSTTARPPAAASAVVRARPSWRFVRDVALILKARSVDALRLESEARRLFLWTPVAAAGGVVAYFDLPKEPDRTAAWLTVAALAGCAALARRRPLAYPALIFALAFAGGFAASAQRTADLAAGRLNRIRILNIEGFIEQYDPRPAGARLLVRVARAQGLDRDQTPFRIRVTTRRDDPLQAGDFVRLKARLLPPARAVVPGGYDFSRDAYFARIGAVGNALGRIRKGEPLRDAPLDLRLFAAVDRARNALGERIRTILKGPAGAVAVAMVTGKRDFLDESTKEVIRQAGIFHIITISGVQMTLVAGVVFFAARRLLALSRVLALDWPIKAWAAMIAIAATGAYDLATGSRIGEQRAFLMTLALFGAVLCGRRALSMRNLALAALIVIALEPESVLGASFQLSFSAVTALVAAQEARARAHRRGRGQASLVDRSDRLLRLLETARREPAALLAATACATGATASFMAYDFHELSPYVLLGNPLTLAVIELFAVPAALLGSLLYPLRLDAPIWIYLGQGIDFILWAAGKIAASPGSSLRLAAFPPWALVCLACGFLSLAIWTTRFLRTTCLLFVAAGLAGLIFGSARYAAMIAPSGEALAVRGSDGALSIIGRRASDFVVAQWLSEDGDGRAPAAARLARGASVGGASCGRDLCLAQLPNATIALAFDASALQFSCAHADVVVSPLAAPASCGASAVFDRTRLARTGAVGLRFSDDRIETSTSRLPGEDRPWSPAPFAAPSDRRRKWP